MIAAVNYFVAVPNQTVMEIIFRVARNDQRRQEIPTLRHGWYAPASAIHQLPKKRNSKKYPPQHSLRQAASLLKNHLVGSCQLAEGVDAWRLLPRTSIKRRPCCAANSDDNCPVVSKTVLCHCSPTLAGQSKNLVRLFILLACFQYAVSAHPPKNPPGGPRWHLFSPLRKQLPHCQSID
jgi:hypothetical protein